MREAIEVGYQAFVSDGGEEFGGSGGFSEWPARTGDLCGECGGLRRATLHGGISTFAEGHLGCGKLEPRLRQAIGHAHDAEEPNA